MREEQISGMKSIEKLFPEGLPLENWEGVLVYIGSHEARHICQSLLASFLHSQAVARKAVLRPRMPKEE